MACKSAAWVLGGVRLISSASSTWANTGPGTKRNARRPVVWSSSSTSVPVMSLGIRSGVNWMRLKLSESASASVEMSSVLASPGTPTNRQWPREKSAISSCSMTPSWPTTRLAISWVMRERARASSSISSASDAVVTGTPLIASSLMMSLFTRESRRQRERLALPLFERRILESLRDFQVGGVQVGVEGIHGDSVVERNARLVQCSALHQHARVQRLRRLVVGVPFHGASQRLFRLGEPAHLHLGEGIPPRELRHLPRQPLPGAGVLLRRRRPAPAPVEDLPEPGGALSLLVRGNLDRSGVQGRRLCAPFRVFLEDQLLRHQRPHRLLRGRLRARLLHFRAPVRL